MLRFSLFFALGAWCFYQLPVLPAWAWMAFEAALAAVLLRSGPLRPVLALIAGFGWAHLHALVTEPPRLPDDDRVMELVVSGQLVSAPQRSAGFSRFVFEAREIEGPESSLVGSWRLRLSWRDPPELHPGQVWRLPLRLRAVHGYASPGAWDYEGWLYWQGIRYKGYVLTDGQPELVAARACCRWVRLRSAISTALDNVPASAFARGVMRAITVGDSSGLSAGSRKLLRDTGTSHLVAISGLHIGLFAGLAMFITGALWRRIPNLCVRVPAMIAGAAAGLAAAAVYALLAGMALPTQRALIMLAAFAVGMLLRRSQGRLHALAMAVILVVLWHPPSIISAGFWLSFGAVLAIIAILQWTRGQKAWHQALGVQLGVSLGLWPILSTFGLPASAAAPLVNLLLVPLFGFVVVPFSLLGTAALLVWPDPAASGLSYLGELLDLMEQLLQFVGRLPLPDLGVAGTGAVASLMMVLAMVLLLSPPGMPLRWLGLPLIAAVWMPRSGALAEGEFALHLLDVGQGLSTVIETGSHTLVFDTGPEYPSGFSAAAAVVEPFLATLRRPRIDRLVLSHGDRDHAGGIAYLVETLDVEQVQSGEPGRVGLGALPCRAGERWQWDGVGFEFLHPLPEPVRSGNDSSCVLRVSGNAGVALLTGDIGTVTERKLVDTVADRLKSRIVVVPHHGSTSSSSAEFVTATAPEVALFASGWANRYAFPDPGVASRWRESGSLLLDTASAGTISLRLNADGSLSAPRLHRAAHRRFWWHIDGSARPVHAVSSAD